MNSELSISDLFSAMDWFISVQIVVSNKEFSDRLIVLFNSVLELLSVLLVLLLIIIVLLLLFVIVL